MKPNVSERTVLQYVKLDFQGTEFQKKVWQALLAIPFGQTRSYGEGAYFMRRLVPAFDTPKRRSTSPTSAAGEIGFAR